MATANEILRDAAISHAIDLQFYANDAVRRVVGILNAADSRLFSSLIAELELSAPSGLTAARIADIARQIESINSKAYTRVFKELDREVELLARYELQYQSALFKSTLPVKAAVEALDWHKVSDAAAAMPFQGRTLSQWAKTMPPARLQRIQDAISVGYVRGLTTDQIVRTLRGSRATGYADGILEGERRNIEAITRTALGHISGMARDSFYEKNKRLVSEKVWVATLDNRTTPACQIRDGLHYTVDGDPIGHKVPWLEGPGRLHWNCRSSSMPVVASWKKLGLDITEGERASMDGAVAADTTYADWLGAQSAERQDEVLGPTRGRLFRKGGIKFDRFFNDKGRFLTLAELEERDKRAFTRAKL